MARSKKAKKRTSTALLLVLIALAVFIGIELIQVNQRLGEAKVQGPFSLFGREHQLTFGAAYGRTHQKGQEYDEDLEHGSFFNTSFSGILAGNTPMPSFAVQLSLASSAVRRAQPHWRAAA